MKTLYLAALLAFCSAATGHGFELILIGYSRAGVGNELYQRARLVIKDAIAYTERNYSNLIGIVMTGDYVKSGKNDEEWNAWIDANARAFDYPVYPCVGNHDDENADCEWWDLNCEQAAYYTWSYYRTFNVERWWSKDVEGLHLISLDSNLSTRISPDPGPSSRSRHRTSASRVRDAGAPARRADVDASDTPTESHVSEAQPGGALRRSGGCRSPSPPGASLDAAQRRSSRTLSGPVPG